MHVPLVIWELEERSNPCSGKQPDISSKKVKKQKQKKEKAAASPGTTADNQDLNVYWDPKMADLLEKWGEGNAWHEIDFLMANCHGKVLDIACGTGKNMMQLAKFLN